MMQISRFMAHMQKALRHLSMLVVGCAVAFTVMQPTAVATQFSPASSQLIALAASSRFAAPSDEALEIEKMSERRREELREKRRQWQNRASEAAAEEAEQERIAEEVAQDKLNLQEIEEENPVSR